MAEEEQETEAVKMVVAATVEQREEHGGKSKVKSESYVQRLLYC